MNIFFVGDELVGGKGDPKALGWTGRVAARTVTDDVPLTIHELAVPGETTSEMSGRWQDEVLRRVKTREPSAVVFAVGRHDARRNISHTMTKLNLSTAIDQVTAMGFACIIVGPPPSIPSENERISELAATVEDAAKRRKTAYVDMFSPLVAHEQWLTDMSTSRDGLPGQAGYGLMAWLVLHAQWRERLGLPPI